MKGTVKIGAVIIVCRLRQVFAVQYNTGMSDQTSTIRCPSCATAFRIATARIGAGGRILKCGVCGHRFLVRPLAGTTPAAAPAPEPPRPVVPLPPPVVEEPVTPMEFDGPLAEEPVAAPESAPPMPPAEEESFAAAAEPELGAARAAEVESDDGGWEVDTTPATPAFDLPEEAAADNGGGLLDLDIETGREPEVETAEFPAMNFDQVADDDLSVELDLDDDKTAPEEDDGMVEFLVEDEEGHVNRVETRAAEEAEATRIRRPERRVPVDVEMPDDTMVRDAIPGFEDAAAAATGSPAEDVREVELLEDDEATRARKEAGRWRDPMRGGTTRKKTLLKRESEATPTSGIFYLVLVMLIGGAALATNFIDLGTWRFDPVWACSLIGLAILGFFLQNLSGLYIAGFFGLIHALSLFSRQAKLLEYGQFNGAIHLSIIFGLSMIFLVIYYVLMNRKRGRFFVREGKGQSLTAFFLGLAAVVLGYWAHLMPGSLPALGRFTIAGVPIADYLYYGGTPLDVVFQAGLLSLTIAFGISARRVGNSLILLGILGILMGLAVMFLLFAPLFMGEIQFLWPV